LDGGEDLAFDARGALGVDGAILLARDDLGKGGSRVGLLGRLDGLGSIVYEGFQWHGWQFWPARLQASFLVLYLYCGCRCGGEDDSGDGE
jgi:hypothetical protein